MHSTILLAIASHNYARKLLLAAIGVGALVLVMMPSFWRMAWAPTKGAGEANGAASAPMSRGRIMAAYGVILFIGIGSLVDWVRDTEHWPWSNYPMYSEQEQVGLPTGVNGEPIFDDYRLYGVSKNDPSVEVSMCLDGRYIQPFDPSRIALVIETIIREDGPKALHEGLADCLQRYEILRKSGKHDGPELSAMRVYRVYFTLDPWARNADSPDRKELIDEVKLSDLGKS